MAKKTSKEKKQEYEKEVLKALEKNPDIYQFCDLELIVPYDRSTLYKYDIDKIDKVKEKLASNKMKYKRVLRNDMRKSKNSSCLIALYKLLATPEERDALNNKVEVNNNVEITTKEAFLKHLKEL